MSDLLMSFPAASLASKILAASTSLTAKLLQLIRNFQKIVPPAVTASTHVGGDRCHLNGWYRGASI
jgi:hypothetical protein